ncbi:ABC transporter permease subunit [Amycolatopsis sp. RM579]|uniref:ABC transporter permease subunit n=2 Tax=Amycolatopsis pithecellobii TaxID=664692 RepID=A0A6N7Z065_9PSEU|nr:ABC transporter permease subunit [Amycolatopsis pithecellobii]
MTFVARRLAWVIGIMVLVSFLVFSLLAASPGSVVATLLGARPATPEAIEQVTAQYHLDSPFLVQYWDWAKSALSGDFGRSIQSGQTVTSDIASHLTITLQLALYALVLVLALGITIGIVAGIRQGSLFDRATSGLSVLGMSAPGFVVSILLSYLFGVLVSIFPVYGGGNGDFTDRVEHLTLPAVALAVGMIALIVRQTRAAVGDVVDQDYVTFARARGLNLRRITLHYVLRNAAAPVVNTGGLLAIHLVSGAVLVESVFALGGVGQLMVQSVESKDIPVVQGLAFFIALFVVCINLLVDVVTLILDPRTRDGVRR